MRIGFLSDLHITHNCNMLEQAIDIVKEVVKESNIEKLFLAGDTSNNYKNTLKFVDRLSEEGIDVSFIFGNHEYWSMTYEFAKEITHDKYVSNKIINLGKDTVLVSIDGFFDYSFVREVNNYYTESIPKDIDKLNNVGKSFFDLKRSRIKNYEEVFNSMNSDLERMLKEVKGKEIIMMLHYVPSEEFVSYTSDKIWNACNSFMGSKRYRELAEEYKVNKVIFGHTHTEHNREINGVSYHCNPVGYGSFEFTETFRERVKNVLKIFEV